MASNLIAMASNLLAMASNLLAICLIIFASTVDWYYNVLPPLAPGSCRETRLADA